MAEKRVSISKESSGFAAILVILAVVAIAGIGGLAYWRISSYNDNKDSSTTSGQSGNTNSATLSKECVAQTGDENICHLGAISDISAYSSEVKMTIGTGSDAVTSFMKFDGKGNYYIDAGSGLLGMSVGGKYYIYMDKWYDTGNDPSQVPKSSVPSFGFATTAGIKYENQGKEACGSATCFKYKLSGGMLGDGVVTTLFGDKDYLPRSLVSKGGFLGDLTMTVEYKSVTVTAPADAAPISQLGADLTE